MDHIRGSEWVGGRGGNQEGARGGARAIWHSSEGPTIEACISAVRAANAWPHVSADLRTGRIVQHLLPSQSARSVSNMGGGVETNRYGVVLQVEVIAHAVDPFTRHPPLVGLDRLLEWMDANGVPRHWPSGQPLAYGPDERRPGVSPAAYGLANGTRSLTNWVNLGGHYAHSQIPENDHGDPGRVDITAIIGQQMGAPTLDLRFLLETGADTMLDAFAFKKNGRGQDVLHYSWVEPDGRWHYRAQVDSRSGQPVYGAPVVLAVGVRPDCAPQHVFTGGSIVLSAVDAKSGDVVTMQPFLGKWVPHRMPHAA